MTTYTAKEIKDLRNDEKFVLDFICDKEWTKQEYINTFQAVYGKDSDGVRTLRQSVVFSLEG